MQARHMNGAVARRTGAWLRTSASRLTSASLLAAASLLTGCNGGDSPVAAMPPAGLGAPMQIKEATPAQVLALAQTTSEVAEPLIVTSDSIASVDVDDATSYPIPVI